MSKAIYKLLDSVTTTGAGTAIQMPTTVGNIPTAKSTFQAIGSTSSGSGSATIKVQVSNDGTNFIDAGTITLTLSTTTTSDGFSIDAPWAFIRGNTTAISGTNAAVTLYMAI